MVKRVQRIESPPSKPKKTVAHTGTASVNKKADILIAVGTTGSGKSTRCNGDIERRNFQRIIIWDDQHEYEGVEICKTLADLKKVVMTRDTFKVRFLPSFDRKVKRKQFDVVCRIALMARKVALVAEELSQVVDANGGGPGWTQVITAGRHRELAVYGTTQRPALVDKTALGMATRLYIGNLELPSDMDYMARMLGIESDEIKALGPWDYIERHRETKEIFRGNLAQGAPTGGHP